MSKQCLVGACSTTLGVSCRNASRQGSHIGASSAKGLCDGYGGIIDTSTRRDRRKGRGGHGRRSRRFCNGLYFWELLGADTVSEGNALLPPIGSPGNGSGDKLSASCQGLGVRVADSVMKRL